jgi:hypothetical protein
MGAQFENVTYSPEISLTLVVDDIMRRRSLKAVAAEPQDLMSWLNALQRQAVPLVQSGAARANLEAWLEAVDEHLALPAHAPSAASAEPA